MADADLNRLLQSISDVMFPDMLGEAPVAIDSRSGEDDTPLHVFCWRGDVESVKLLIDSGAEVDPIGDMGQTPLHVACMRDDLALAEVLLKYGASPYVRSEFGDTPLELACSKGGRLQELFELHHQP